jgi:hypothetical protein
LSKFFGFPGVIENYERLINNVRLGVDINPPHFKKDLVRLCIAYKLITRSGNSFNVTMKGNDYLFELMKFQLEGRDSKHNAIGGNHV